MTNDPKKTALGWIPQLPAGHANVADPNKHYPQPYGYDSTAQSPYPHQVYNPNSNANAYGTQPPPFVQEQPTVYQADAAQQAYAHYHGHEATALQPSIDPAYQQQYEAAQAAYAAQYQQQQQQQAYAAQQAEYERQMQAYYAQQQQAQVYQQQEYARGSQPNHHEAQYVQAQHAHAQHQQQQGYNFFGQAAAALQQQKESPAKEKKQKQQKARPIANADATSGQSARVSFIRKTYIHLFFAILGFAGLLWAFRTIEPLGKILQPYVEFATKGRWNWGIVLAAFMVVSWVADQWAERAKSKPMQYAGLALYVLAEAVIFVPLLVVVEARLGEHVGATVVRDAAFITLGIFFVLTLAVVLTKKDFSFLRNALVMASGAALVLIAMSIVFGFHLGIIFSFAMVFLAGLYILYQTSQVLAHYDPESHVAASLALFSSVALMFWYVIRILAKLRSE